MLPDLNTAVFEGEEEEKKKTQISTSSKLIERNVSEDLTSLGPAKSYSID